MSDHLILTLNCGSSSLKAALIHSSSGLPLMSCLAERLNTPEASITVKYFEPEGVYPSGRESWFYGKSGGDKHEAELGSRNDHRSVVEVLFEELESHGLHGLVAAAGHRVAHGGEKYSESVLADDAVMAAVEECCALAPLHNPANLAGIRAVQQVFPGLPNAAVFDTSFHQTMPDYAYRYAVPERLYREHGIRRYGFHGTSYRYVAAEAAKILGKPLEQCALVIAHIGNGASVCAVKNGKSMDTSMGVTPLEGLVMGTRSGDLDPGIFSILADNAGMDTRAVTDLLNKQSGLLGLSGLSNDCRTLQEAAAEGHEGAALALETMSYRLAKYIAAMAVAADGLDAVVFTGGIGENSDIVRAKTLGRLKVLGLETDPEANLAVRFGKAGRISKSEHPAALVVPTNEERMIAQDTAALAGL
ncbi:acetate kinase [Neisseria sp.]|uniref:acetate kinase n=1 Tax=Neisseria sp. TaxID=192066 RepID=UPI0035A13D63